MTILFQGRLSKYFFRESTFIQNSCPYAHFIIDYLLIKNVN